MPKKVMLWTGLRSLSTAFERCIREIEKSIVFHEPYMGPFYFGPERGSQRFSSSEIESDANKYYIKTYKEVESLLCKEYDGMDLIFNKDQAYHMENHLEVLLAKELSDFQHTFLIRNPRKTIPSLYRVMTESETGFNSFDPNEIGMKQLHDLYEFVKKHFDNDPVVVDADDLLSDPEGTIKAYCAATGIPFDKSILTWEAGLIPEWEVCGGWHDSVMNSTGFSKKNNLNNAEYPDLSNYPEEVRTCVDDSLPYYEVLQKKKMKF